jgi:DNA-binding NtrC family response regulator
MFFGQTMSHVLLVEDNPEVALVLGDMLEACGHTSVLAHNATDAFVALDKGGIDVVITDVRLPGAITGEAVAEWAEAMGIGRVLITGYGDVLSKLQEKRDCIWLKKPFRSAELARAVAAALQSLR